MKLLLDENLPKRLKVDFAEHEIYTVREMGWNGIKNGQLMELIIKNGFDALLTFDKNLQHQQNFAKYTVTVFVLTATINTYSELSRLTQNVKEHLKSKRLKPGPIVISPDN